MAKKKAKKAAKKKPAKRRSKAAERRAAIDVAKKELEAQRSADEEIRLAAFHERMDAREDAALERIAEADGILQANAGEDETGRYLKNLERAADALELVVHGLP